MAALDTNVLVRWLTDDDAAQSKAAARLLSHAVGAGERLFIPATVLLEMEWVLRSRYRFDRLAVAEAVDGLLSAPELELQDEPAVERALWLFRQEGAEDFADCLHIGLSVHASKGPLLTCDTAASKLDGAKLLRA